MDGYFFYTPCCGYGPKKMPAPRNCYYDEKPRFDEWERTYNNDPAFPEIYNSTMHKLRVPSQSYDHHEHLFKSVLLQQEHTEKKKGKRKKRR
jgi:hypothetical protein